MNVHGAAGRGMAWRGAARRGRAGRGQARLGTAWQGKGINRERILRVGDWHRGAAISLRARRLIIEWWTPGNGRYRVWKLGPLELQAGVPW